MEKTIVRPVCKQEQESNGPIFYNNGDVALQAGLSTSEYTEEDVTTNYSKEQYLHLLLEEKERYSYKRPATIGKAQFLAMLPVDGEFVRLAKDKGFSNALQQAIDDDTSEA